MNKINFCWRRQAFASYQTWLPQVWRKCFPSNFFKTQNVGGKSFLYNFQYLCMVGIITIHVGRCYCLTLTNTLCLWQMILPWQMLLPCFVCCFFYWGWCFYSIVECISCINKYGQMLKPWLMLLPVFCGRCFKPLRQMLLGLFLYMLGWCYCLLMFYVAGVICCSTATNHVV